MTGEENNQEKKIIVLSQNNWFFVLFRIIHRKGIKSQHLTCFNVAQVREQKP